MLEVDAVLDQPGVRIQPPFALRSFSAEQITTSALASRRRSSSRICCAGASEKALNSSTQ